MTTVFNSWVPIDGCASLPQTWLPVQMEQLTITAVNTFPPLTLIPAGGLMLLLINGRAFAPPDGSFTVSGQTITWLSTLYSAVPGDMVVAIYTHA